MFRSAVLHVLLGDVRSARPSGGLPSFSRAHLPPGVGAKEPGQPRAVVVAGLSRGRGRQRGQGGRGRGVNLGRTLECLTAGDLGLCVHMCMYVRVCVSFCCVDIFEETHKLDVRR